jgi:hypothetical protein
VPLKLRPELVLGLAPGVENDDPRRDAHDESAHHHDDHRDAETHRFVVLPTEREVDRIP